MTPAEEKRVRELTEEIAELKKHLTLKSAAMTNRDTSDELEKIGELLSEKNALTGLGAVSYTHLPIAASANTLPAVFLICSASRRRKPCWGHLQ